MLNLQGISKTFGENRILSNVSFTVGGNEIIGLVGKNGAGKSTLFKILAGELRPDSGMIHKNHELIGYLPQHQSVSSLSGGEKTRLYLTKILFSDPKPTVLLLDEPTNNLDLQGILWLEKLLIGFDGPILLSSHDRQFLDDVADTIIELDKGSVKTYGGNYSFYREQKEIEQEAYERRYKAQQKKIRAVEEDILQLEARARSGENQFGSGMPYERRKIRKSAQQMASRKKRLEKFLNSERHLREPEKKTESFIRLAGRTHSTKSILFVKKVSKRYSERQILDSVSFSLIGGDRAWLSGSNGSGKSTLFKIIVGETPADSGSIEVGTGVRIGYFSQEHLDLQDDRPILNELMKTGLTQTEAYKLAVNFRFGRDELTKKISQLSRGQKAKVAFAKLTYGGYQLLLLDEPTNHLEIETRETIEEALRKYQGAIMVASHDRYFLEGININKRFVLDDGCLKMELG